MASLDTLLHPLRFRILRLMIDGVPRTPGMIGASLGDVPTASLYRHIRVLEHAGVLESVEERRVRGAVERTYRLAWERTDMSREAREAMTPDDHRRAFLAFMGGLVESLDQYLRADDTHPVADGLTYQEAALWLSDHEHDALMRTVKAAVLEAQSNGPAAGRRRRSFAVVAIPTSGETAEGTD